MNMTRIALASAAAFVAYMAYGFAVFALVPSLKEEFQKYPAVYRAREDLMKTMPLAMVSTLVELLVLSVLYAMLYRDGPGALEGLLFGALVGIFSVCNFVIHNYVNLNVGVKLTVQQAVVYFVQWSLVGLVIGLVYRPS